MSTEAFRTREGAEAWGQILNDRGFAGVVYLEDGKWVADFPGHNPTDAGEAI